MSEDQSTAEPKATKEPDAESEAAMTSEPAPTAEATLDYETARDQLADVVRRLEAGGLNLEESLALWERGEALAKLCERHLAGARERVEKALAAAEQAPNGNSQ